jgi:hypothetical protein
VFHETPIEMGINAKESGVHQEHKRGEEENDDDRETHHISKPMAEGRGIVGSKSFPKFIQSSKLEGQVKPTCSKNIGNPTTICATPNAPPCKSPPM